MIITKIPEGLIKLKVKNNRVFSLVCIDENKHKIVNSCRAKKGDVLMALSGATTGKIGIVESNLDNALVNQRIAIIRAFDSTTQDYLRYIFTGQILQKLLINAWGAAQPNLSSNALKKLEIPLPPLEEQKRIARKLDKADEIRRKRKKLIRLTDELLRSTFLDMFGDIKANKWELSTVENIIEKRRNSIRTSPFGSKLLHNEFVDEGIAVLGIDNAVQNTFKWAKPRFITEEKYAQLKRFTVYPDDLLV